MALWSCVARLWGIVRGVEVCSGVLGLGLFRHYVLCKVCLTCCCDNRHNVCVFITMCVGVGSCILCSGVIGAPCP